MYEQYTDEQIVEMLIPKMNKCSKRTKWDGLIQKPWGNADLFKVLATIYRSAYIRGQLGRSFIIGEKKERDSDIVFQVGDGVKLINRKGIDKESNRYYPPIGTVGKVVELGSDYCFVQWPKGVTAGDRVWACPNHCLEKVTEHWVPATRDNVKVGDKVKMIDGEANIGYPCWFPVVGVVGVVTELGYNDCEVQWLKGTIIEAGGWWCNYKRLEVLVCE